MTTLHLNGADLHGDRPASPDATSCWLSALEDRRTFLSRQLRSLDQQAAGAAKLEEARLNLVRLAEAVVAQDSADLEKLRGRLDEFDAETERLQAEAGGRLKRARAQLEHRRNSVARGGLPAGAEDIAALESEVVAAEKADGELLARRLATREPLRQAWLAAARRGVHAGLQFLALAEPDLPALRAARGDAATARKELEHLNALAALAIAAEDRNAA